MKFWSIFVILQIVFLGRKLLQSVKKEIYRVVRIQLLTFSL